MKQLTLLLAGVLLYASLLQAQNVGISQPNPQAKLHVTNPGNNSFIIENSQSLSAGVENHLHFKIGSWYTGGIRSIGTSGTTSRLGFFTKSNLFATNLQEQMTITDDG